MAVLELQPFDFFTEPARRVMALQPFWANLASLGATSARLLMVTDFINYENALAGFNRVAVPFNELPADVRWYRSYYEDYLRGAVRETQYMRVFLIVSSVLDDKTLARVIEGYGIGVRLLDGQGVPLPFDKVELQWDKAKDMDTGKVWGCVQSTVEQSGSIYPQIMHRMFNLDFPVWCAFDIWNYSRTEAIRLLRTKAAVAMVSGSDEKLGREAKIEAREQQQAIDAFRAEINMAGVGLHEIRLSVVAGAEDMADLEQRFEVVRGACGLDLNRKRSNAAVMRELFSAEPPSAQRGSLVTSTGAGLLSGSALSFARPTKTDGVLLGYDPNQAPVVINIFDKANSAYNAVVVGQTGAGKTFFILLLMLRSLLTGVRLIIIDPKGDVDLSFLGQDADGNEICQRAVLGTKDSPVNILDVSFDELSNQIEFVTGILTMLDVVNRKDTVEMAVLDQLLAAIYLPIWEAKEQGEIIDAPTLKTLQALAHGMAQTEATSETKKLAGRLAFKLEPFITGSRSELFGRKTQVDFSLDAPVTIFDVSNFPSRQAGGSLRAALFATLFSLVNQGIVAKRKQGDTVLTQFFVDEIGVMMRDEVVADFVSDKYKTARSLGVSMIVADQTVGSLVGPADKQGVKHGNEMFANAPFRFVFFQEDSEMKTLEKYFPTMPDAYRSSIHNLPRGQAIAQTPQGIMRLIVVPSELERIVLSSRLQDKQKAQQLIKKMRDEITKYGVG